MAAISGCHPQLLRTVIEINKHQRLKVIQRLRDTLGTLEGQTVALLGLAFKPNTDDLREAPALEIAHLLLAEGATVRAYDPVAMPNAAAPAARGLLRQRRLRRRRRGGRRRGGDGLERVQAARPAQAAPGHDAARCWSTGATSTSRSSPAGPASCTSPSAGARRKRSSSRGPAGGAGAGGPDAVVDSAGCVRASCPLSSSAGCWPESPATTRGCWWGARSAKTPP